MSQYKYVIKFSHVLRRSEDHICLYCWAYFERLGFPLWSHIITNAVKSQLAKKFVYLMWGPTSVYKSGSPSFFWTEEKAGSRHENCKAFSYSSLTRRISQPIICVNSKIAHLLHFMIKWQEMRKCPLSYPHCVQLFRANVLLIIFWCLYYYSQLPCRVRISHTTFIESFTF